MKKQLSHISVHQTGKVIGILYFALSALFLFPYAIYIMFVLDWENAFFAFLAPFLYGLIGYIFGMLLCWIYNQIAALVGGIEFTVEEPKTGSK